MAEVDCRIEGRLGRIRLDRPRALNALTHAMIRAVSDALVAWHDDPRVVAVLVTGEGERAFCAGGDVRAVAGLAQADGVDAAMAFFFDEYRMNWRIKRFGKPYIAFIDGVTMGGGVGISVHGSHRIATEATLFAMPETAIGMFPDVGGTYVLGRMPGGLGLWLAMTGHRLGPVEALEAGIATHYVPRAELAGLEAALRDAADAVAVDAAIVAAHRDAGTGEIGALRAGIDRCFDRQSVGDIVAALAADHSAWAAEQWRTIAKRSPISVKLAFAQVRRGRTLGFDAAMRLEYRMVRHVLEGHDFFEGVRAVIVDKDQTPAWRPASLDAVDDAAIEAHFASPTGGDLPLGWR